MINQLGGLLILNAAIPFLIPRVSWQAHLGGLIAGFVIGWVWTSKPVSSSVVARVAVAAGVLALSIVSTQVL